MHLPTDCEKCGKELKIDRKFTEDSISENLLKVRLYCQDGHSYIFDFQAVKVRAPNTVLEDEVARKREVAAIAKQEHSRTRSTLCDICRQRIYEAGPNQKRHKGECQKRASIAYSKRANIQRSLETKLAKASK